MNTSKLNNWLQIAANLGIILGLILVGFQMRQNSNLLGNELAFNESQRNIDVARALIGENPSDVYAKHLTNLEELSFKEHVEIEAFYFLYFENWKSMRNLVQIGLIEEEELKVRIADDAPWLLNNPYGMARWENVRDSLPAEIVEYANYAVEENPQQTLPYYEGIFLRALQIKEELQN